jgi:hypothetical protein
VLIILVLIPALWRVTVTSWGADIAGIYSLSRAVLNVAGTIVGFAAIYLLLGRQPRKEKIFSVILGGASLTICLGILEAAGFLSAIDYQKIFRTGGGDTILALTHKANKPDPILLHIHWPNSSFSGEVSGNLVQLGIPTKTRYRVDVNYDQNGFRNDREYETADIAVIGDSFVEAAIVAREDSLVAQLETRLGVETVNLGQISYGLRQELEVLKRFALPLRPKLIVWVVFGGNDLRDVEYYERNLNRPDEPEPSVPLVQKLFLRNALVAGGALIETTVRVAFQWPKEKALEQSGMYQRSDGTTQRVYFVQSANPWSPHEWQVAVDTLIDARNLTEASGAEFLLVYVPRKYRVYRKHISVSSERHIAKWEVNNLPQELGRWCAENGIRFVDTSPALEALVAKGRHPYLVDDVHWNALGHETAANTIIEDLSLPKRLSND